MVSIWLFNYTSRTLIHVTVTSAFAFDRHLLIFPSNTPDVSFALQLYSAIHHQTYGKLPLVAPYQESDIEKFITRKTANMRCYIFHIEKKDPNTEERRKHKSYYCDNKGQELARLPVLNIC